MADAAAAGVGGGWDGRMPAALMTLSDSSVAAEPRERESERARDGERERGDGERERDRERERREE